MRLWRKRIKYAGCTVTAVILLFFTLLFTGLLESVSNEIIGFLPISLILIAAACFGIYVASEPANKQKIGGNIFMGILIVAFGCALAALWFIAGHPEL